MFNGKRIELVSEYEYLGNIIRSTETTAQDMFSTNYPYLYDRANRATFLALQKLKNVQHPPPHIMFHIFDTLIMPILTYGSDVWGHNKNAHNMLDKVFLRFLRCTLGVKCTTSNIIVYGECGRMPPSTKCTINSLCFMNRLMHMGGDSLTKKVYYELENLTQQGFDTWVGALCKIYYPLQLNLHIHPSKFRQEYQDIVRSKFIQEWTADIADTSKHPILRTYRYIKSSFRTEPYLYRVNDKRYHRAMSQLRCSSHILNVEQGQYTRPRTRLDKRLCNMCNCVDDELHFITACAVNVNERRALYDKLIDKFPQFEHLCALEKNVFLFTFDDAQMLSWLGKFLYKYFRSKSAQTECL